MAIYGSLLPCTVILTLPLGAWFVPVSYTHLEKRMAEIAVLREHIVGYAKTRDTYVAYIFHSNCCCCRF